MISENLNEVVNFSLSDLMKGVSLNQTEKQGYVDKRHRKMKTVNKEVTMVESSPFKISNKIAVHGTKVKKPKLTIDHRSDLLWLHKEKLNYLDELQTKILPKKQKELLEFQNAKKQDNRKITRWKKDILDIENKVEETDYHAKTKDIVNEYEKMLENEDESKYIKDDRGEITKFFTKYDNIDKQRITEEYCRILNNGLMINTKKLVFDNTVCKSCGGETKSNEGFLSCVDCGLSSDKSIHDFRLSYHDYQEIMVKSPFSYQRISRFQDILSTLQAKENKIIPEFVMNSVQKEIDKDQNIDVSSINEDQIKYYLKRLSLSNYYDQAPHILNKVNGIPPVQFPLEVEDKLREMFELIQDPFEIVKTEECSTRISFLSYKFVLYKFCELLDLDEYKKCFKLLKSIEKLRLQDRIWKGICEILGWEYIPSV
jgi:hypothetical protein